MNRRGFTLLEVLVAMVLLLIGVIAISQLILLATIQANLSATRTVAEITASSQLATLKAGGLPSLDQWLGNNVYHQATAEEAKDCLCTGWNTSVTSVASGSEEKIYRVTITINSVNGREETFVTYLADIGPPVDAGDEKGEQPVKIYERK